MNYSFEDLHSKINGSIKKVNSQNQDYIKHILQTDESINGKSNQTIIDNVISLQQQLGYQQEYHNNNNAIKLLYNLGIANRAIQLSIVDRLKLHLDNMLVQMNNTQLNDMLVNVMDLINMKELRFIVVNTLKQMTKIPECYLNVLISKNILLVSTINYS